MKATATLPHDHGTPVEGLISGLRDEGGFFEVASVFRQLDDPTRVRIFWLLCHKEECAINLSALLGISQPGISHHLKLLREAGLILPRRDGKEIYYSASGTPVCRLLHEAIETLAEMSCPDEGREPVRISEQSERVRRVHRYLLDNLAKRITIEELSRRFHINPTTLKSEFRAIYGSSIAAHIKKHRLERASELLLGDRAMSIAEVASAVGYDSQSRFAAAFKEEYGVLPREYRNKKES